MDGNKRDACIILYSSDRWTGYGWFDVTSDHHQRAGSTKATHHETLQV